MEVHIGGVRDSAQRQELRGEDIVRGALRFAGQKMNSRSESDTVKALISRDEATHGYFRYGLAAECAKRLGALNDTVRQVYLFLENRWDILSNEPILIGLVVTRKAAALEALADVIEQAAHDALKVTLGDANCGRRLFHFELLDGEAVSQKRGLAAMLGSIHEPPLLIWPE